MSKLTILLPLLLLSCTKPHQHIYSKGDRVRAVNCGCAVKVGYVDSVWYRGIDASEYRVVSGMDTVWIWDVNLLGE